MSKKSYNKQYFALTANPESKWKFSHSESIQIEDYEAAKQNEQFDLTGVKYVPLEVKESVSHTEEPVLHKVGEEVHTAPSPPPSPVLHDQDGNVIDGQTEVPGATAANIPVEEKAENEQKETPAEENVTETISINQ